MLADLLKFLLELLKLAPRYFVLIAVVAAALLFMPSEWLDRIGVSKLAAENKQWLGLTLLVSSALWCGYVISTFWDSIKRLLNRRKNQLRVIKKLQYLTEGEKQILRYYVAENTRTNVLKVNDGVVQGLVASRIIYRAASIGDLIEGFAHNITDLAWDYLHLHPEVLDGTTNFYRTDKRQRGW